ncbi:polysaccharide deacetylase family protein [Niameybacter sp.]|uniref:polysaccharide deacetylase family protein n=1 Tax=Niameybacter sp. TaxID=2033640 RepID=UPI002FC8E9E3
MKKSKLIKKIYIGVIIGVSILVIGSYIGISKGKQNVVDVYAIRTQSEANFKIGINEKFLNENNKYEWVSLDDTIENHKISLENVQIKYTPTINIEKDLQKIADQYSNQQVILIIQIDDSWNKKSIDQLVEHTQYIQDKYADLSVAYPIEYALKLYKKQDINYAYINVKGEEELKVLSELPGEFKDRIKIIINDCILEEQQDLIQQLDLISRLYYQIPLIVPNIEVIFQQADINKAHYRVVELYNMAIQNKATIEVQLENKDDISIVMSQENLDLMLNFDENIEQVTYKLNENILTTSYRYPFKLDAEDYSLMDGINVLKIIIKLKNEENPVVQNYYIDCSDSVNKKPRAKRKSNAYTEKDTMIYDKNYIPVLMYHEFKDQVGPLESEQSISVETQLFREQLQELKDNGYTTINFKVLKDYLDGVGGLPDKPVIITTDDGYLSNYTKAYPILKEFDMQATYFITPAYVGIQTTMPHFTWEQAQEMEESGLIDMQSHTFQHALLDEIGKGDALYQISTSFAHIEEQLGERDVKVLAYPQFQHNKKTKEWAQSVGIDLQATNLIKNKGKTETTDIKRIHVSNTTTPEALIKEIEDLTIK